MDDNIQIKKEDDIPSLSHTVSLESFAASGQDISSYAGQIECVLILEALHMHDGNQRKTAEFLKINRSTLTMKLFVLRKFGLSVDVNDCPKRWPWLFPAGEPKKTRNRKNWLGISQESKKTEDSQLVDNVGLGLPKDA